MIVLELLVVIVSLFAIATGSPVEREPKIALDGLPFLYEDDEGTVDKPISEEITTSPKFEDDEPPKDNEWVDDNDRREDNPNEMKRSALRVAIERKSRSARTLEPVQPRKKFIPAMSVGAVMNLRDFFASLKSNVDMLESKAITPQEFQALASLAAPVESFRSVSQYVEDSHIRPTANAAYLHAMRMYRPSHRIRSLVKHHPETYRGANNYNPQYLWTGLG